MPQRPRPAMVWCDKALCRILNLRTCTQLLLSVDYLLPQNTVTKPSMYSYPPSPRLDHIISMMSLLEAAHQLFRPPLRMLLRRG